MVESNKEDDINNGSNNNGDDNVPLAKKRPASPESVASTKRPRMVTSKEGKKDVEMRGMTLLATVTEVEREASNMEVKGKEKFKAATVAIEEDKEEDKDAEEAKVYQ
ncbi:hypothetical protein J132_10218 [Termitomyces sp. J132]|nr:hypothetical protein J132_10218 [Termitomyces sp. J132]